MNNTNRKPLVAGNWKMNGSKSLVTEFINTLRVPSNVEVVVCPPSCYLSLCDNASFSLGAQNVSAFDKGAHTGETSLTMLKEFGVNYVIVGHSERRENHAESNNIVASKVKAILDAGLTPILCVGEPLDVREAGGVFDFVKAQLDAVAVECGSNYVENAVVAYEPIWAIGTGETASPEQAQEVHEFIRNELGKLDASAAQKIQLLYGGSVNASNADELFAQKDIDGGLIGGASLKVNDFTAICQAAS